jgi:amino acid transporter
MTAISTILGAILFLRFGYAVAHVGLAFTLLIILVGHLVTIPTAMAVAEIATNQKVEGGGAYYMISRSFGLNIGGAIGIALFLSQAISVAFYIIAFTRSCGDLLLFIEQRFGVHIEAYWVNYGFMALLTLLMLSKGANVGVKALYGVVVVLLASLCMFFLGSGPGNGGETDFFSRIPELLVYEENGVSTSIKRFTFFEVFTFIFPAFTGIAAGLGLSGDLKNPKVSIPKGTLWATVCGIVVYICVALKLYYTAPLEELAKDELYMEKIAIWGPIIPIGLACAAVSSALGSIMIAPRTLQALGGDSIIPGKVSRWLGKGRSKDNEPINASLITVIIGFVVVSLDDINAVAEIISMFFMLTYGVICMVSFFEHMAADPSYRPNFKSKWYVSLFGGLLCFYLMFKMNFTYALASIVLMVLMYIWISRRKKEARGIAELFKGIIFQITRTLQITLQKRDQQNPDEERWRPFILSISSDGFERRAGFDMVRWIAYRYGFGTYIHFIEGFLNNETREEAGKVRKRLIKLAEGVNSRVYLDTIISPSYTSAIAQGVQLPGVSGKGNNMILFEYPESDKTNLQHMIGNFGILKATALDICVLRSSMRGFGLRKNIHLWITSTDFENANLIILMGYVLLGHPEWRNAQLSVFTIFNDEDREAKEARLMELIKSGRVPISPKNVQFIRQADSNNFKDVINERSKDADLTVLGFNDRDIQDKSSNFFDAYEQIGNALFVNAQRHLNIE